MPARVLVLLLVAAMSSLRTATGATSASAESDAASRTLSSANAFLGRGLNDLAAKEYRRFLRDADGDPRVPTARYGLAVALQRLGEVEKAADELEGIAGLDGFEFAAESRLLLGHCRLQQGQFDRARDAFGEVAKLDAPDLADDGAAGLVEASYRAGRHDEIAAEARRFARRWPQSPLRDRVEYFSAAAEAVKSPAGAVPRLTAFLQTYAGSPLADHALLLLAQCQQRTGNTEEAIRCCQDLLRRESATRVDAALLLASLLLDHGRAGEARVVLESIPEVRDANAGRLQLLRGRALLEGKQYQAATEAFEALVDGGTDVRAPAAYWLAKALLRQGDAAAAATRFQTFVEQFADSELTSHATYDMAVAWTRAGSPEKAHAALQAFRHGLSGSDLAPQALHLLAGVAQRLARHDEAAEVCAQFNHRFPDHTLAPEVALIAAENERLRGEPAKAAAAYAEFLKRYGDHPQADGARLRMGIALHRAGQAPPALAILTHAISRPLDDAALAAGHRALGEIYFDRGEWKQAADHLGESLRREPSAAGADDALLKRGLSLQREKRLDAALACFAEITTRFPESVHVPQAKFEQAQTLMAKGQSREAERLLAGPRGAGDDRLAPYQQHQLGVLALQRSEFAAAVERFGDAAKGQAAPGLVADALYHLGLAHQGGGDDEKAARAFGRVCAEFGESPRATSARLQLAICLARGGKSEQALAALDEIDGSKARLDDSQKPLAALTRARCLRALNRAVDAAQTLDQSIREHPKATTVAHAILERADIESAAQRYEASAVLLRPLCAESDRGQSVPPEVLEQGLYRLGLAEYHVRRFDEAARALDRLLERFPQSSLIAAATHLSGECHFKAGRHDAARSRFERVVNEFRGDASYEAALLRLGDAQAALQAWAHAERTFSNYLAAFPESKQWFQAQFGLGWARENQNRYEDALKAYRAVVERHEGPTAARAQFQIGECLFALKKYDDAVAEFLKVDVLYAYPEWSAAALYEAGRAFQQLGRTVEARNHFRQVIEKHEQSRWRALAEQRLTELASADVRGR